MSFKSLHHYLNFLLFIAIFRGNRIAWLTLHDVCVKNELTVDTLSRSIAKASFSLSGDILSYEITSLSCSLNAPAAFFFDSGMWQWIGTAMSP